MLEVKDIYKNFRGVKALKGVSTSFRDGEIHGLIGENGAGKSTLMKIVCGQYQPTGGTMVIDGEKITFRNPREAYDHGIRIVHQELSLIRSLSIAENIFIHKFKEGRLLTGVDRKSQEEEARKMLLDWEIDIEPSKKVSYVSMGIRQLVEIARELSTGGRIIILDEPTSSLTVSEIVKLFAVLRKLRESGIAIIFISHRLNEVTELVDRITVLRDGEMMGTSKTGDMDSGQICKLIAGTDMSNLYPKIDAEIGSAALEVRNLTGDGFRNVDIEVKHGEIVGLAGLVGAGRSELCRAIFGLDRKKSGEILLNGEPVMIESADRAVKKGIVLLSENRSEEGIFPELSVSMNILMLKVKTVIRNLIVRTSLMENLAREMGEKLNIVTYDPMKQKIGELSGGNQQKVLFGRLLATEPDILILDEPTRGVDINNKTEIHKFMGEFAAAGGAVLMVSSELDEVIGICDRIYVLHEGDQSEQFVRGSYKKERILQCMMGLAK